MPQVHSPPWTAEHEISPQAAAAIITAQFPELVPVRCEPFGVGWDNVAFLVNAQYVFRFPRRKLGAELIQSELKLLAAIAPRLPLPISAPQFVGEPTPDFPWFFAGYRLIEGTTACRAALSASERTILAPVLGRFLRSLHAIDPAYAHANGAGPDTLGRLDMPRRAQRARDQLAKLRSEWSDRIDIDGLLEIVNTVPIGFHPRTDVLVHGDLYSRHLIIDDSSRALAGIIDWGDVHLGDPAADLMAMWLLLPPDARRCFLDAYGPVDAITLQAARVRAIQHSADVLPYCEQTQDQALLAETLRAMEYLSQA